MPPWWDPEYHADRRPLLEMRGRIRQAIRRHFQDDAFMEVECAALQISPGNEAHLNAFATERIFPDDRRKPLYLHTSPEFACKKLLAAGERRIFTFSQVYRNREHGPLNVPEFTMLEWYRAEEAYEAVMRDAADILRIAAAQTGEGVFRFRGRRCEASALPQRMSVAEAFREFAAIDLLATMDDQGNPKCNAFAQAAAASGIKTAPNDRWSDIFSRVLTERIEPNLGIGRPAILDQYPRPEAALARATAGDPRIAERFELYVCGVELANGFGELNDPDEQRRRFEEAMAIRVSIHGERYPLDEEFLSALRQMPAASGVALGFDRLVMLATAADSVQRVMWTPPDE